MDVREKLRTFSTFDHTCGKKGKLGSIGGLPSARSRFPVLHGAERRPVSPCHLFYWRSSPAPPEGAAEHAGSLAQRWAHSRQIAEDGRTDGWMRQVHVHICKIRPRLTGKVKKIKAVIPETARIRHNRDRVHCWPRCGSGHSLGTCSKAEAVRVFDPLFPQRGRYSREALEQGASGDRSPRSGRIPQRCLHGGSWSGRASVNRGPVYHAVSARPEMPRSSQDGCTGSAFIAVVTPQRDHTIQ